ncbi:hypothetical protein P3S68_020995 [Capsicum galapagoense]
MRTFNSLRKGIVESHILELICDPVSLRAHHSYGTRRSMAATLHGSIKCLGNWMKLSGIWANTDNVREALHIRKETSRIWEQCRSNLPFTRNVNNNIPYHAYLYH